MAYKPRPGVTMLKICGVFLLAPTRAATKECPNVLQISPLGGMLWRLMEKGRGIQSLYLVYASFTRKPDEEVEHDVGEYLGMLHKNGFLIEVPDEEADHDGA